MPLHSMDVGKLAPEMVHAVMEELVRQGRATAVTATQYTIWWKLPEEWADVVERWVQDTGRSNTICTLYELCHEPDVEWRGMDPATLLKCLTILQKRGKCVVMPSRPGASVEETGVKFQ